MAGPTRDILGVFGLREGAEDIVLRGFFVPNFVPKGGYKYSSRTRYDLNVRS